MDNALLPLAAVTALAADPDSRADFSPFGDYQWLLFDNTPDGLAESARKQLSGWLQALDCPTLVVDCGGHAQITAAADVVLKQARDALPLLDNIARTPRAATLLVQLLRGSDTLDAHAALAMESLTYATLQAGSEYQNWLAANRCDTPAQPDDDGPAVVVETSGDHALLTLNRASNRNAFNVELRDAVNAALDAANADPAINRVTVRGNGKCFSVGGDLSEFGRVPDPPSGHMLRNLTLPARHLLPLRDNTTFQLHGACIGAGIELPAFAGHVTADPATFFQLPELRFGLIPGAGGCVSIPRRIGRQRAAWLMLSGKRINAQKALAWGLVDAIEPTAG